MSRGGDGVRLVASVRPRRYDTPRARVSSDVGVRGDASHAERAPPTRDFAIGGGRRPRLAPVVDGFQRPSARAGDCSDGGSRTRSRDARQSRRGWRRWRNCATRRRRAEEARSRDWCPRCARRTAAPRRRRKVPRARVPRNGDARGTRRRAAPCDFAASVNGMRRGAVFGAKLENTSSTPMTQTPRDEFGEVAKATALRELLGEAADPAVSEVCRALLSAVDVEAARGGKATPATALLPNARRFPELERTRGAVADARRAMDELLPALRQNSSTAPRDVSRARAPRKVTRPSTGVRHRRAGGTPDRASGYASRGAHDVDARVDE